MSKPRKKKVTAPTIRVPMSRSERTIDGDVSVNVREWLEQAGVKGTFAHIDASIMVRTDDTTKDVVLSGLVYAQVFQIPGKDGAERWDGIVHPLNSEYPLYRVYGMPSKHAAQDRCLRLATIVILSKSDALVSLG